MKDSTRDRSAIIFDILEKSWEPAFNEITQFVDWDHNQRNVVDVKISLVKQYSTRRNIIKRFSATVNELHDALHTHLFHEVIGLGDDGYDDLIWHIIGIGPQEIRKVTINPQSAQDRADAYKFRESFVYVLPEDGEWDKCYADYHIRRMHEIIGMIEVSKKRGTFPIGLTATTDAIVNKAILITDQRYHEAFDDVNDSTYDKYVLEGVCGYLATNYLLDAKRWLLKQ